MSGHQAILRGWFYVPLPAIGGHVDIRALKDRLTYMPRYAEEGDEPVTLYDESMEGYLGIPRAFGMGTFRHLDVLDETTEGLPMIGRNMYRRPDPNHPSVREPARQRKFMDDLYAAARQHETFLATAPTGSGKTVSFLDMSLQIGRKTLILVHLERLMDQWVHDSIIPILGVPEHRVGIVQGPKCDFENKDFVVAMLHSMNLNEYPREFYSQFGLVGVDEVHKIGSRFFAPAMGMFPALYRVGLSATPKRKDGGDRVFVYHLGPIRVVSEAEAMPMDVYPLEYSNPDYTPPGKFDPQNHGVVAKALSGDRERNKMITRMIKRFYDNGRQALVVGEGVRHLQELMDMAHRSGVPREAMGQFTSEIHVREVIAGPRPRVSWKKRKQKREALSYVKENSQLLFATYGMMTEGIDIPRLDAGIDVTPRGSATQLIGRIRRPRPNKRKPIWVTLVDTDCPVARRYFTSRCRDYSASGNVEIINGKAKKSA